MYGKKITNVHVLTVLLIIIVVVAVGGYLYYTSIRQPEEVTITFFHWELPDKALTLENQLLNEFEERYPWIDVKIYTVPRHRYDAQALTKAVGENPHDIIYVNDLIYGFLASKKALMLLDNYITKDHVNWTDFIPGCAVKWYDKHIYGMPFFGSSWALYYDVNHFKVAGISPPTTWQELTESAIKLTVDINDKHPGEPGFDPTNIVHYGYGFAGVGHEGMLEWFNLFLMMGGKWFNDDFTAAFNDTAGIESLSFYVDLANLGAVPPPLSVVKFSYHAQLELNINHFSRGLVSMIQYDQTYMSRLESEHATSDWDCAPIPAWDESRGSPANFVWLGICSGSKHKDEAWAFIEYVTSTEVDYRWATTLGTTPVHSSNLKPESPFYKEHPKHAVFLGQAEWEGHKTVTPLLPQIAQFLNIMEKVWRTALSGEATPEKALESGAADWNQISTF